LTTKPHNNTNMTDFEDDYADLDELMNDIELEDDDELSKQLLAQAERELLASNPALGQNSEQEAAEALKRKIADNRRLAAEKRALKEEQQMKDYMAREEQEANASSSMAERIAQRKRDLAEKKSQRRGSSNVPICCRRSSCRIGKC